MTSAPNSQPLDATGSPPPGEPVFLAIGQLGKPHGVRGEIILNVLTDFPERLRSGKVVYVGKEYSPIHIQTARVHGQKMLVLFENVTNREQADELRNQMVFVRTADIPPLPEGEYYQHQLIGLKIISEHEQDLGLLEEILETGANDVYLIRMPDGNELLLPAIDEVIQEIDMKKGSIRVHVLPGLLPE